MYRDETILLVVDLDQVWKTADADVPDLLSLLEPLLPKEK
jgi:uncharacterized protein with HEPN domain